MTDEERRMFSNRLRERDAEIERLRADKDVQRSQDRNAAYEGDIALLEADNERLRAEGCAPGQCKYGREILAAKDAEIERLTTECNVLYGETHMLRADNERLRTALQEAARRLIANGDGYGANEATRASGERAADDRERAAERGDRHLPRTPQVRPHRDRAAPHSGGPETGGLNMLARPEIGTREHILLWLASRDPNEEYDWCSYAHCACGKYAREVLGKSNLWWVINCVTGPGAVLSELNFMASYCKTFGELEKCASKRWAA